MNETITNVFDEDYVRRMQSAYSISTSGLQTAKADAGKPQLTLVPRQIIYDIAEVREYGTKKYGDPNNWKKVEIERYRDAAFRHFMAYLDDPCGKDAESGIYHLSHLACNIAFLCELERKERPKCGFVNVVAKSLSQSRSEANTVAGNVK